MVGWRVNCKLQLGLTLTLSLSQNWERGLFEADFKSPFSLEGEGQDEGVKMSF